MLRKFFVVTLSLVLVLALAATATAGVRNTIHDFQSAVDMGSGPIGARVGFEDTAQRGMCSYCHIPHSSKGDRLWPSAGEDSAAKVGIIGVLCASCHNNPVGDFDNLVSPYGPTGGANREADIYSANMINHVLIDDGVYANNTNQNYITGAPQFGQVNTWPYCVTQGVADTNAANNVRIECSSCHNPHSEVPGQSQDLNAGVTDDEATGYYRYGNDFLRASFYNRTDGVAFCEYCHEEKTRDGAANNVAGTGTHPVGESANAGDTAQADIHIESAERAGLLADYIVSAVQYDMGIGTGHNQNTANALADDGIGTHLTGYTTGGVTCQTCHKVHGAPGAAVTAGTPGPNSWQRNGATNGPTQGSYDNASRYWLAASDDGDCNILAVENDANGGTAGYTYWTEGRTASDYNDLCIDCHETTPSVGKNWALYDGDETRAGADGAGVVNLDSHPVNITPDGKSESGFDLTVQDPAWTNKARWAGGNGIKMTVPTAGDRANNGDFFAANGRFDGTGTPTNTRNEIVCLTCHSLHDGEDGSPILRSAGTTFCSDCHTFSIGIVSHPVNYGAAMRDNPDNAVWPNGDNLPLEDYYQGTGGASFAGASGDTSTPMACFTCHAAHDGTDYFMLRVTDDNSRICTGCHTDIVALGATGNGDENPANYIAEYTEGATERLASHYTGTVSDSTEAIGESRWAFSGAWTDTGYSSATAQTSHWNGNANFSRMQCQSCHTPHNAASGLVEANAYDGNAVDITGTGAAATAVNDDDNASADAHVDRDTNFDGQNDEGTPMCNTPTTALLLGNNSRSKMCATCHWPEGTHVTTIFTVPAKPDPERDAGTPNLRKYRDYCTRIERTIITNLRAINEQPYNVYDLIANDATQDALDTPESPTSFPPLRPGQVPAAANDGGVGEMLCDSCHAPHAAGTAAGAFILDDASVGGDADPLTGPADITLANQRVESRNYQELCWDCHDK